MASSVSAVVNDHKIEEASSGGKLCKREKAKICAGLTNTRFAMEGFYLKSEGMFTHSASIRVIASASVRETRQERLGARPMMGGKTGAVSTATTTTSRRAGAGTIGETAAIARRAAARDSDAAAAALSAPVEPTLDAGEDKHAPATAPPKPELVSHTEINAESHDGVHLRRSRAGAGLLKEAAGPDRTAAHLILAGRAYAYGMHIMRKDDGHKPGVVVAIVS
jgi:hypothetical protein